MKLHVLLKSELGEDVTHGRDSFLKLLASEGLMLPKNKRRRTTDSNHPYRKYPNLVQGVTAMYANHIWAADITYVWIYGNVLYLHLITDVYSHAVIGWCLSETMEAINTKRGIANGS
ncbi:DDE-type integrase/transposase/recombinase [Prevotella corporis]|uniref:DDE-type integrase/transposase/recombinase n=1 Tax=Prevotella corporis TaxID=28128 RepID=UPI002366CBA9|nr:DDE-type integrase/transposase/recombinase [Prevotella corporis]